MSGGLPQKTNMLGKWHRFFPEDFWRGNKSMDAPPNGATVAIYFSHTGYDVCEHVVSEEDIGDGNIIETNCFTSKLGFLGDEDLLWSEDTSFATNREPIPDEYLEDYHHALDNPDFPYPVGPSGNPEAIQVREYIELGPVPYEEDAVQMGSVEHYEAAATVECKRYARQLERLFPDATFGIKWFSHDFGRYPEVVVYYDPEIQFQVDRAFQIEGSLPAKWDPDLPRFYEPLPEKLEPCEKAHDAEQARLDDEDGACDDGVN